MYFIVYRILCWLDKFDIHIVSDPVEDKAQRIFNKIIDGGFYNNTTKFPVHRISVFMCHAADEACCNKVISQKDYIFIKKEIKRYIKHHVYLSALLKMIGHPSDFEDRLDIYKNWASRPFAQKVKT